MSRSLVAFAGNDVEDLLDWRLVDAASRIHARGQTEFQNLPRGDADRFVLVLRGEHVTARRAQISAKSEKQAHAVAPFAVEEDLAVDVEDVETALALEDGRDRGRVVYALDKTYLQSWLAADSAGGAPDAVCADYCLLPQAEGLVVARLPGRVLLRDGAWGASVSADLGKDVAKAVVGRIETEAGVKAGLAFPAETSTNDALDAMAVEAATTQNNLLQGDLRRSPSMSLELGVWRAPAALAASVLMLFIGFNIAEGVMLQTASADLKAETERALRTKFPEIERVVNARAQLRAAVNQSGGGDPDFLVLSSMLAAATEQSSNVTVETLRYDASESRLRTNLVFSAYDDLAALKSSLETAGANVEEGASRQLGDRRAGDIIIWLAP